MTLTNKYELHSPWQFTIGQMSAGQGPGFSYLCNQLRVHAASKVAKQILSDL